MKKILLIPPIITSIILLPAIMFSLFPNALEAIFQTAFLKPFVIFDELMLTAIFSFLKPWFWIIVIIVYYILCIRYAIKKITSFKPFVILLTIFCLISLYGNITAYELMDAIVSI